MGSEREYTCPPSPRPAGYLHLVSWERLVFSLHRCTSSGVLPHEGRIPCQDLNAAGSGHRGRTEA